MNPWINGSLFFFSHVFPSFNVWGPFLTSQPPGVCCHPGYAHDLTRFLHHDVNDLRIKLIMNLPMKCNIRCTHGYDIPWIYLIVCVYICQFADDILVVENTLHQLRIHIFQRVCHVPTSDSMCVLCGLMEWICTSFPPSLLAVSRDHIWLGEVGHFSTCSVQRNLGRCFQGRLIGFHHSGWCESRLWWSHELHHLQWHGQDSLSGRDPPKFCWPPDLTCSQ